MIKDDARNLDHAALDARGVCRMAKAPKRPRE